MKKNLQFLLYSLFLISQGMNAQTLTAASNNPQIGETFTFFPGTYTSPGNAGNGMLWNFSSIPYTTAAYTYSYISTAPAAPHYSGTPFNIVRRNSQSNVDEFCFANNNGLDLHGYSISQYTLPYNGYSNAQSLIKYPLSMGSSFVDTWSWQTQYGATKNTVGSQTIAVDGTGTLTTAFYTYTNAVRIKIVQTYTLYSGFGQTLPEKIYNVEKYTWQTPGIHADLFTLTTTNGTVVVPFAPFFEQTSAVYSDPRNTVGLDENYIDLTEFQVFPNPANNQLNLSLINSDLQKPGIEIMDINGKIVPLEIEENQNGFFKLNTSNLSSGIYLIKVNSNGIIRAKRVSISH